MIIKGLVTEKAPPCFEGSPCRDAWEWIAIVIARIPVIVQAVIRRTRRGALLDGVLLEDHLGGGQCCAVQSADQG